MSVIVYRNGIMASDSRGYSGSHRPIGKKPKIRRFSDGTLVGVATGTPGLGEWLLTEWWDDGHPDIASLPLGCQDKPFAILAVEKNGRALFADDSLALAGPIEAPYFAVGSGGSYALGALAHGASAVEAAAIAADLDPLCGSPICYISHKSKEMKWT